MKIAVLCLVLASCVLERSLAQTILSISLEGGDSSRIGRLRATITTGDAFNTTTTTAVCGGVDMTTAFFVCQTLNYVASPSYGTANDLGLSGNTTSDAQIADLRCSGTDFSSQCQFRNVTMECDSSQEAAISCILTPGEVAGISIGILACCLLTICTPIIIACCCCCGLCACVKGYKKI